LLTRYGHIESFPPEVLGDNVDELEWRGPTAAFPDVCERFDARVCSSALGAQGTKTGA
jgi:hypothetical protein